MLSNNKLYQFTYNNSEKRNILWATPVSSVFIKPKVHTNFHVHHLFCPVQSILSPVFFAWRSHAKNKCKNNDGHFQFLNNAGHVQLWFNSFFAFSLSEGINQTIHGIKFEIYSQTLSSLKGPLALHKLSGYRLLELKL